jgi:hypothetical protein
MELIKDILAFIGAVAIGYILVEAGLKVYEFMDAIIEQNKSRRDAKGRR